MATITKKGNSFHVAIRKKNYQASATFGDRETAELWAKYKEEIYNEMPAFDPPLEEMFTLSDAIELKVKKLKENDANKKTIQDTMNLQIAFEQIIDIPICEITLDHLSKICERMLNSIVQRGGYQGKGKAVQQSVPTVHRKFRYLSVVFSLMQEQGLKITNHPLQILRKLEEKMRPKSSQEDLDAAVQRMNDAIFANN